MLAWSYLQRCTFRLNLLNLCRWQELQSTLTSLDLQINSNSPVPYFGFDFWGHRIGTGTLTQAGQFVFYSFLKPLDTFHIPETRPCWSETSPAERPGSSASLYREDMHIWRGQAVLDIRSIGAPHTRKSLVKGERFIRYVWKAWVCILFFRKKY